MAKKKVKKKKSSSRGGGGGITAKLREMGRGWKDTVARAGGGGFPIGRSQEGIIKEIVIEESQQGNLQVTWLLEGTSEGIVGMKHRKRSMLMTEENREYLRGEMETIGLVWPDSIEDLGDALGEAENAAIRFDVVQGKDEFVNVYFVERLEEGNGGGNGGSGSVDGYTRKEIIALGKAEDEDELTALAKESKLNPDDYDTWVELADEIINDLGL